jgi:hypothetical protein
MVSLLIPHTKAELLDKNGDCTMLAEQGTQYDIILLSPYYHTSTLALERSMVSLL